MAISEQATITEYQENNENYTESEGSDSGYDSNLEPSYIILEDSPVKFSNLSTRKNPKSRTDNDLDHNVDVDENEEEIVKKIVEAGQLEKLKVEQCHIYLRKNGLRLTGNKSTLIQRIREHLEVSNGEGEKKYPISSFVLNCKGDACTGDVVMFEQNVYEMFNIASRSASGPPCGKRIVVGRIVKESYGAAKQQHTFTVEVLWSKGEKPLSPLHPLLIKGRNLYRLKTLRQRWDDEGERHRVLMEKHSRGSLARSDRETRIQGKEKRKMLKANRMSMKKDGNRIQSRSNSKATENGEFLFHQSDLSVDANKMATRTQQQAIMPQEPSLIVDSRKSVAAQPQLAFKSRILPSDSQEPKIIMQNNNKKQLPQNPVKYSGIVEMQHPLDAIIFHTERTDHRQPLSFMQHPLDPFGCPMDAIIFHTERADYRQPNFDMSSHQPPTYKYPNTNQMNSLSEWTNHRQPLKSINHFHPMEPPPRLGSGKQQMCRYYAQGRCHFGDNCKFLHEKETNHSWQERWHCFY
ncbi:hypothetical protein Patl1_33768 [Pistacia atlantica]|uniref:Uncharacterized protein n=1 Tax=Pistacia atlantica TaxID=434234 RepID=A0ACC0ZW90_9ROSI|nr:hypothetical protein Patl1_33768 [Pistacia atlantica]